jgi:small GTP-binding protein
MIGFPSVGKSTLLGSLTETKSETAAYEFTTLTCIPGVIHYKEAKIQLLDLPGIIEGAAHGKGRGRQVIAVAKSSDLILMVLDASKGEEQKLKLTRELELVGLRLNKRPPEINFVITKGGGLRLNSTVRLSHLDLKMVRNILHEYKIHNADILIREDCTVDDFIDVIEGNRKFIKCLYVYNKIDSISIEDVDEIARRPNSVVISCHMGLNMDFLLEKIWEQLALVRVYTKKRGCLPDFHEPIILTQGRNGCSVQSVCEQIHKDLVRDFKFAFCWGKSAKFSPQRVGLNHILQDEDVMQILKKTKATKK